MAHTNNWDETNPTNTSNAIDIDDEIRKVRLDVRERLAVDHYFASSDTAEAERGIHKQVTLQQAISAPTPSQNNQSILYRNSSDNDRELRHAVKDANGTTVQDKLVFVGEVKFWLGLEANIPTGWLALKGSTVGSAASGATYAGTVYQNLYYHLWNNLDNTAAPVSTGRGASAAADWSANKTITMPDARSKMVIGGGQASGMTLRKEGYTGGNETHTLTEGEMPSHNHTGTATSNGSHVHTLDRDGATGCASQLVLESIAYKTSVYYNPTPLSDIVNSGGAHTHTLSINDAGSDTAHDIMNPWIAIWMIIKY